MDTDAGRMRIGWHAGVVARIVLMRFGHYQFAWIATMSYPDPTSHVIVDHPILVVPEHINRRLRTLLQQTRESQRATRLDKLVWPTHDLCPGLWKAYNTYTENILNLYDEQSMNSISVASSTNWYCGGMQVLRSPRCWVILNRLPLLL
jgi:hypothetical protein